MIKHIGIFLLAFLLIQPSFAEKEFIKDEQGNIIKFKKDEHGNMVPDKDGTPMQQEKPKTLQEGFDNPGDLTDAEADKAKHFSHEGYRERKKQEACAANEVNCAAGSEKPTGFSGILIENMGKAYVAIFGAMSMMGGGGGPTLNAGDKVVDGKVVLDEDGKAKQKKQTDYCMYGAMGWEMIMLLAQTSLQGDVEGEVAHIKDIQVKSLTALKKNHEARQKTATMQAAAYGVVSVCYAAMLYTSAGDPMLYVKGVSAIALTVGYGLIAKSHADAAAAVQRVIESLPDPGDCNPYTGATCFCKEPSSPTMYAQEYQHACVRKLGPTDIASGPVGCASVDKANKMTFDKQCKCKQTNSCNISPIKAFTPNFGLGSNLMKSGNEALDLLASGNSDGAKLSASATTNSAAALKSFKLSKAKLPTPKLNTAQAAYAAELSKTFPADYARMAAVSPSGKGPGLGQGKATGMDNLPKDLKEKLAEAIKANYNAGSGNNSAPSSDEPGFVPPTFGEKAADENEAEVLSFADKAMENADVNNSPDTPIFDIISNRYRRSWQKVDHVKAQ